MSSSDARMFDALAEEVRSLGIRVRVLEDGIAALLPKPMGETLYGAEPDHGADREARAALLAKRRDR